MTGFKPRITVVGSDHATNCATNTASERLFYVEKYFLIFPSPNCLLFIIYFCFAKGAFYEKVAVHTYIHPYVHTYIRIYIHTYIHLSYIHTYIHMFIHPFVHTSICTYIHTYVCSYIHMYIHPYVHTSIHTYVHTSICTYIHTHVCTYIHIYIHTYAVQFMIPRFSTSCSAVVIVVDSAAAVVAREKSIEHKKRASSPVTFSARMKMIKTNCSDGTVRSSSPEDNDERVSPLSLLLPFLIRFLIGTIITGVHQEARQRLVKKYCQTHQGRCYDCKLLLRCRTDLSNIPILQLYKHTLQ